MKWSELIPKEASDLAAILEARTQECRDAGAILYPPQNQIFRALNLTPPEKTRVVIMGQDPYHTPYTANGLAFSVNREIVFPPSLNNINKELYRDCGGRLASGDLTSWAEQGVLLLNSVLTVYEHQANSCASWGWQKFTRAILHAAAQLPQPIVFLLWGANAQDLKDEILVDLSVIKPNGAIDLPGRKKHILMSSHPSPFSALKPCRDTPPFIGSSPFSRTNSLLLQYGEEPIRWATLLNGAS